MCYVEDVVIATPTLEDHIERLDEIFTCMKQAGLKRKHPSAKSWETQSSIWVAS